MEQRAPRDGDGFTLIELMIVVAILAIIASIAIPNLMSARLRANEAAAIATLKAVSGAQAQCKASGVIDVNHNGAGEFGYLAELAGERGIRDITGNPTADRVAPKLITIPEGDSVNFLGGPIPFGGAIMKSGYYFTMFLPSASRDFIPEGNAGGADSEHNPNPAQAESLWCCYAWPVSRGNSGARVLFINQTGDILSAKNISATSNYSGKNRGPNPASAFAHFVPTAKMSSRIAANTSGKDGQRWIVVN